MHTYKTCTHISFLTPNQAVAVMIPSNPNPNPRLNSQVLFSSNCNFDPISSNHETIGLLAS